MLEMDCNQIGWVASSSVKAQLSDEEIFLKHRTGNFSL